jgi:hypothetical protein
MNTNRSPEQIESDIDGVRERMDSTLDELEHRLDARRMLRDGLSQLADTEVIRYAATAAASAGRAAREHPVPTALAGVGLLGLVVWGMRSGSHARTERTALRGVSDAVDTARERLNDARRSLMESTGGTRRRMREAGGQAWHHLEDMGGEARSMARSHPVAAGALGLALVAVAAAIATPGIRKRVTGRY